jgi:hypothetical protein
MPWHPVRRPFDYLRSRSSGSPPEAGKRLLPLPVAAWHATVGPHALDGIAKGDRVLVHGQLVRRFFRSGAGARGMTEVVASGIKKLDHARAVGWSGDAARDAVPGQRPGYLAMPLLGRPGPSPTGGRVSPRSSFPQMPLGRRRCRTSREILGCRVPGCIAGPLHVGRHTFRPSAWSSLMTALATRV